MLKSVDFYFFSPTGGTKQIGDIFCSTLAEEIEEFDLCKGECQGEGEVAVVAVPVFAGRIASLAGERISAIKGNGAKVVTLAVFGNRAYEDALIEANDVMTENGFKVVGAGAFNARHSVVAPCGAGRPDADDTAEIKEFAVKVLEKLESGVENEVTVPGNRPYKPLVERTVTPLCTDDCGKCGKCAEVCPAHAIKVTEAGVETDVTPCFLCMACVAACPKNARVLPDPLMEAMNKILLPLAEVRAKNEYYL